MLPAVRSFLTALAGLFMSGARTRIAVYFDWQNVYKTAREAFGLVNMPNEHGNFSPFRLAQILAAGNGRGTDAELVRVEIHRGLPSQRHDPMSYAANRRQSAAWIADDPQTVIPKLRPLRYPRSYPQEPAIEKGVDVNLALAAVEWTLTHKCDVAIVFSHDNDLLPVPETITRLMGPGHVETASWQSPRFNKRLRPRPPVYHHTLTEAEFHRVETVVNYAYARR